MLKKTLIIMACAACAGLSAQAAEIKVGFVNAQKILTQSAPAVAAQEKLKKYFSPREQEVNKQIRDFKARAEKFEKDKAILSEAERLKQHRSLGETERDIARKQRALFEERNQRGNEEMQGVLAQAGKIIQAIAKEGNYDLIVQDAIWFNPRIDITDKVIARMNKKKAQ